MTPFFGDATYLLSTMHILAYTNYNYSLQQKLNRVTEEERHGSNLMTFCSGKCGFVYSVCQLINGCSREVIVAG